MTLSLPVAVPDDLVQTADYPPGATFGPRRLEAHEFVWITRGSARWVMVDDAQGRSTTTVSEIVRPGMLVLARRGAVDSYQWDAERPSSHAYVHFQLSDTAGLPEPELWPSVRHLAASPVLAGLCRYLLELTSQPTPLAKERSQQVVGLLLDLFVRGPLPVGSLPLPEPILRSVRTVRQAWRSGVRIVGVEELACSSGVSSGHLFRLYRSALGIGPARALELVRLVRAAVAMQRSNASLAAIAGITGFADQYHLSHRFSATYGRPPGAFRAEGATADPLEPVRTTPLLPFVTALMSSSAPDGPRPDDAVD